MKKRILTWLLAISMLGSLLTVPAGAAAVTKFSDVSDSYTATAVESLRLMGVLDGYGDGTFRPNTALTRAQFCKMAVYAMDGSDELGRYSTVTSMMFMIPMPPTSREMAAMPPSTREIMVSCWF